LLFNSGDYVQAGEKIWGALAALVNSKFTSEVFSVTDKKRRFLALAYQYQRTHPQLYASMHQIGFRRLEDVWYDIYGLHKFFYGGANYDNQFLSQLIPFLIQLMGSL
jgi:hypothetical protein